MDKPWVGYAKQKRIRRILAGSVAAVAFLSVAWAVPRITPAARAVDAAVVFPDTVKRGQMVRQVCGIGTLVPETVVVIAASYAGRVERRFIQSGQAVVPGTVLLEPSSPQVEQEFMDAEAQLREAQADLANLQAQLEDQRITQESVTADVEGQYLQAKTPYEADLELSRSGLVDRVTLMKSRVAMEQLQKRFQLEQALEGARKPSVQAQLAAQHARIEQLETLVALRQEKVDRLRVRSGMDGVLQLMDVEVGQLVSPGDELARVSDPTHLKAELKVPETLVNDVAVGQQAKVDTRNGVIGGEVSRIDPAAIEGTVLVDIRLLGEMPRGARPDLSVDGTIELERLEDVLHVGRPIHAREDSMMGLFKLEGDRTHAACVQVQVGKVSVSTIEIRAGLSEGDAVVLSDMSAWEGYERIRLE
jgi:HlyD family secretion protein